MASGVVYNHLPEFIGKLRAARSQILRKTVLDIERAAKQKAPVRTGFLKSSIYGLTTDYSGYQAQPAPPGAALFPEVARPEEGRGLVVVGASYGIFVEVGTRHMPARPFLTPAAMQVLPDYIQAWTKLEAMLR